MAIKMERNMRKMQQHLEGNSPKNKKNWFAADISVQGESKPRQYSEGSARRSQALSTIFQKYITSMMDSGEVCPELLDLGFSVEKVTMSPDCLNLNISWLSTNSQNDEQIKDLLNRSTGDLRSKLLGLRIMGRTPQITFVKDSSVARIEQVEKLLKIADMGPDVLPETTTDADYARLQSQHIPRNLTVGEKLKSYAQHFEHADANRIASRAKVNVEAQTMPATDVADENVESTVSAGSDSVTNSGNLKHDIYGVDREALMQQVVSTKNRLRDRQSKDLAETVRESAKFCFGRGSSCFTVDNSSALPESTVKTFLRRDREFRRRVAKPRTRNFDDDDFVKGADRPSDDDRLDNEDYEFDGDSRHRRGS